MIGGSWDEEWGFEEWGRSSKCLIRRERRKLLEWRIKRDFKIGSFKFEWKQIKWLGIWNSRWGDWGARNLKSGAL